jgi:hypothetical protein
MFDLQVVCFDCEVLDPTVVLEEECVALDMARGHADECGHHLIIQRWINGRPVQL